MHPQTDPLALPGDGDGVVVILGTLGVDGDDPLRAQIPAICVDRVGLSRRSLGRVEHLLREVTPDTGVHQQGANRVAGEVGAAQTGHDVRTGPLDVDPDQVPDPGPTAGLRTQSDRESLLEDRPGRDSRTGGDQLADERAGRRAPLPAPAHPVTAVAARTGPGRAPRATSSAASSASSAGVAGLSAAAIDGRRPRRPMSSPSGVR